VIRFLWAVINAVLATLFFGGIVIFASLFRVRGRVYSWATREWGRGILWASGTRVVTRGADEVDWTQPQVLVANHIAAFDILAVAAVIPAPFAFIAKQELGRIPFFGKAMESAGHIFVDRSDRQKSIQSLRRAGEKMRREHSTVIIFPEGTRSQTGALQPFKKGAFMLALEGGVRILPVVISGSDRILHVRSLRITPGTIHLHFGEPVEPGAPGEQGTESLMEAVRGRMLGLFPPAGPSSSTTTS
jgi:1-acyl-sn-glycerol-3-phosphate acyltransferase